MYIHFDWNLTGKRRILYSTMMEWFGEGRAPWSVASGIHTLLGRSLTRGIKELKETPDILSSSL